MLEDRGNMKAREQERVRQCNKMRYKGNSWRNSRIKICNGDIKEKKQWKIKQMWKIT